MTACPPIDHVRVLGAIRAATRGPIHARDIAEFIGIRERAVRYIVKDLVETWGYPIVSEPGVDGGFRYADDLIEVSKHRRKLLWLALTILRRARSFDRTGVAARLAGQLELELEG